MCFSTRHNWRPSNCFRRLIFLSEEVIFRHYVIVYKELLLEDTIIHCDLFWYHKTTNIIMPYRVVLQCMGWAWYLANDMQFYVISPLILIPLY